LHSFKNRLISSAAIPAIVTLEAGATAWSSPEAGNRALEAAQAVGQNPAAIAKPCPGQASIKLPRLAAPAIRATHVQRRTRATRAALAIRVILAVTRRRCS